MLYLRQTSDGVIFETKNLLGLFFYGRTPYRCLLQ